MSSLLNCWKKFCLKSRKVFQRSQKRRWQKKDFPTNGSDARSAAESIVSNQAPASPPIDKEVADARGSGEGIVEEGAGTAAAYTAEPVEEHVAEESKASTAAGELLQEDDRVGRPFLNINTDTSAVPRIAVQRQATLDTGNATTIISRSPSNASLTPRLTRDNSQNSQSSLRSRADSKGSAQEHCLKQLLEKEELECWKHHHDSLIPRSALEELITVPHVAADIQARDSDINEAEATKYAKEVCGRAKRLYATLAYTKKGADIKGLLNEGVTDEDLPFVRKANGKTKFALSRKNGGAIETLESWTSKHLRKFDQHQWWMSAPVFRLNEELYELDNKTILPFVAFEPPESKKQGGYSEVYPVRVHPAHHEFWESSGRVEEEPLVAVKQLFSDDENEFLKEKTILEAMSMKNHPHLIKLLATYKYDGKYHLMFPFANANLRKYWDDRPDPTFDHQTVLWSIQQMAGMARGLLRIHNFNVTKPLSISGPGNVRVQKDAKLSVKKGEEWYGRHGDIKPENVLWFADDRETNNPGGILQIADFGLGRFHGRDSRSHVNPDSVFSSPTYEPPECKLRLPVSRAYDMWSLGCLYLEFITWLLKGSAEIEGFSELRGREATATGINDDNFFTVINDDQGLRATVRDQVVSWAHELHANEKCSPVIHELLDLTMQGLLVVESSDRFQASSLRMKLVACFQKAQQDEEYLLKAAPQPIRPIVQDRAASAPDTLRTTRPHANTNPQRSPGVTFVSTTLPRDLVFRHTGTPNHMRTWPTRGPQTMADEMPRFAR